MSEETTTTTTATGQQATTTQNADAMASANATVAGAPEAYVWKGADGADLLPAEAITAIEPIARDLGLSQDAALKFVNHLRTFSEQDEKAAAAAHKATVDRWAEDVRKDAKLGGANFDATMRNCNALLTKFQVSEEDKAFFSSTGLGNHPVMIRLLSDLHEKTSEDKFNVSQSSKTSGERPSNAAVFYGTPKE
jgi:hypothetical protein